MFSPSVGGIIFSSIERPWEVQVCNDSIDSLTLETPNFIAAIHENKSIEAFRNLTTQITNLVQFGITFNPSYWKIFLEKPERHLCGQTFVFSKLF